MADDPDHLSEGSAAPSRRLVNEEALDDTLAANAVAQPLSSRKGQPMRKDEPVEVRSTYEGAWTSGFNVEEERPSGYLIRRDSDDTVLPAEVASEDVRSVESPRS